MHEIHNRFYAGAAMQALFARELAALTPILSGVYGRYGLHVRPHPSVRLALPTHLVGKMIEVAPCGREEFNGALRGEFCSLPFANDSFQLVVAHHSLEWADDSDAWAGELSRVLSPEGVALVIGFNPFGSWRPWLTWYASRGSRLVLRSSAHWSQVLARHQIDVLQTRFPGLLLPNDPAHPAGRYARWFTQTFARFGSSWLLLARKRRSTLTPLRLRSSRREHAISPQLAPGAHRACA